MALLKFKRSATPSKVPTTSDLSLGELAMNTYDGKLYMKKDDGTQAIVEIGAASGGGTWGSITGTLSNQTDLWNALSAKQDSATALTTSTTFGGDVSGTYNAIVVADDSHNHIIANVDGLQAALDAKQNSSTALTTTTSFGGDVSGTYNAITLDATLTPLRATELSSSVNLDTLVGADAGFYYQTANADTTGNNYPSGEAGSLIVQKSAGNATQLYQTYSSSSPKMFFRANYTTGYGSWQRVFADDYHPNADKLTTARTISLTGDVSGSTSFDGSANVSITATVADDSHNHIYDNIDGLTTNGWGGPRITTASGYIDFGPANTSYAHIYTDRPAFYFNVDTSADDVYGRSSVRAPIFYDSDNTAYYLDPNSTSVLGQINFGDSTKFIRGGASGQTILGVGSVNDAYVQVGGSYYKLWNDGQTTFTASGDFRAPIFYDSDNTAYYANPAGSSVFSDISAGGAVYASNWFRSYGTTGWYSQTYAGGIWMNDTTWVRVYNSKSFLCDNIIQSQNSVRAPLFYDSNNTAYYADLGSTGSSIRTAGPVSVGTTSSAVQLTVAGAGGVDGIELQVDTTSSASSGRMFWTNGTAGQGVAIRNTSGDMLFSTGATPNSTSGGTRMTIYSGNYVTAVGSFRAPIFYDSDNTGRYADLSSTGDSIRASGDIVAYYSDDRLKDRGDNIANALDKVQSLNGFHYTANETAQKFGYKAHPQVGVSAQEVEAILPEVVKDAAIGHGYKTVDYAKLVPLLIEAIKELKAEVETLKKG